ncbi:cation diffusion facilitator family transporter [Aneurinibacillus tyrosinisolvens]|uniref:cation diffusion facilitator family transporter n=1 Tax=Aneurinibacillus tyrosinisolvens TaxID=1443435 RepID=UPI00063F99FC|nr:cation diffusion facilitator family transporter [Aneurinibacillus tyrosinisolvens]
MAAENKSSIFAAWISLISNIVLTIIKITVGVLFNSQVMLADGVHNAADIAASAASLGSMKISNIPADEDHPYGHGKAEVIASGIVAIILGLAALFIGYEAVSALFEPPHAASVLALAAALVSLVWKQILYVYTIRIGRKANSKGLIATAYDHLADVYASLAAAIGIGLTLLGNYYPIPYASYGDPVAGVLVSILVLKMALSMGKESIDVLMEKNVSEEKIKEYTQVVQGIPQVKRIDRLRAREHGHYILVDIRVAVPGTLTIQEGHDISRQIKTLIMEKDGQVQEVLVHLNPWYENQ